MQCLACSADNKMLLIDVVADDTTKEPIIERRIYMCSACRHFARRLVFRRAQMPVTHYAGSNRRALEGARCSLQCLGESGRDAAQRTDRPQRGNFSSEDRREKLRSKQAALAEEAAIASRPKLAEPLQVPAAPSEP